MRSTRTRVTDGLLTAAAVGGVVCILAVVLAVVFQMSLIMFKTGSMSPAIPTGSLALVQQIPAADARVGDVTTIEQGGGRLPVTHRIIGTQPVGGGLSSIQMQGDANPGPDQAPYVVDTVRRVIVSVPLLGYAVAAVSNPWALGAITVAAALLVTWAFWPRASPRAERRPTHLTGRPRHQLARAR